MSAKRWTTRELAALDFQHPDERIAWATRARSSSEYSSSYSASSACGMPSVYPESGDVSGTWLADGSDRAPWLEVELPPLERAGSLLIFETCGAGSVRKVTDRQQGTTLYESEHASLSGARVLEIPLSSPVTRVRIEVTPQDDDYRELDAVAVTTVSVAELLATPAMRPEATHQRLAPEELAGIDLRRDRRIHWAKRARASSEYSSSYRAADAIGPPNVFPRGGDIAKTWLSDNDDRNAWLELSFDGASIATCHGFVVAETCGVGATVRALDETGKLLWEAAPAKLPQRSARLLVVEFPPRPPPEKLRIFVSPKISDYREIDAVALLEVPFAELSQPAPPPPPPPAPKIPNAPEGLAFWVGTLIGASEAAPLVHATLRSATAGVNGTSSGPLSLSLEDGTLVELTTEGTLVYADIVRRRGPASEIAAEIGWLTRAFGAKLPGNDQEIELEARVIATGCPVHVAGIAVEAAQGGGYRDAGGRVTRVRALAISTVPLTSTSFYQNGTSDFARAAVPLAPRSTVPHPLARWLRASLVVACVAAVAIGAPGWLAATLTGFAGSAALLAAFGTMLALSALVHAIGCALAMNVVSVTDRRHPQRNRRVPFGWPSWTFAGTYTLVGIAATLGTILAVATADRGITVRFTLGLVSLHAFLRLVVFLRRSGAAYLAARRFSTGAPLHIGALSMAASRSESFEEHSEHTGQYDTTDADGRVTTHQTYRTWNERQLTGPHEARIKLPSNGLVQSASSDVVLDVGMVPVAPTKPTIYAAFRSDHAAFDQAAIAGVLRPESNTVERGAVLFGTQRELARRVGRQTLGLVALVVMALAGVGAVIPWHG